MVIDVSGSFVKVFFLSIILGALIGASGCFLLKHTRKLKMHKESEIIIILIFAMFSQTIAFLANVSPILSLLVTGVALSHYGYYNLNYQASIESQLNRK